MRTLLLLLLVINFSCTYIQPKNTNRNPSAEVQHPLHGLPNIDPRLFSEWTQGLYDKESSDPLMSKGMTEKIVTLFKTSKDSSQFLDKLLKLNINKRFKSVSNYRDLVESLLAARKKIRLSLKTNESLTRESMEILSILSEETLYILNLLFPGQNIVKFNYAPINIDACSSNGVKRVFDLNGIKICQGDILLSKGGAGSSSFISRIGDYPGNFSHSTVPYIAEKTKEMLLIEAEIEDGVKLRYPNKDYIDSKKAKLFVYRAKNPKTVSSAIGAVDQLVMEIFSKVKGEDPRKVASYDYDFAMNANESKTLFCSEVGYYAYSLNKESSLDNPYPKNYWSHVSTKGKKAFLTRFLNTKDHFPAPSDIELNPKYEIVSMHFDISKLSKDRMMVALIDVVNQILEDNEQELLSALNKLGNLGSEIAKPEDIKKKLAQIESTGAKIPPGIYAKIDKVPANINYKQLLFFSFLNEVLAPKATALLEAKEKELLQQSEILSLGTMRSLLDEQVEASLRSFASTVFKLMQ